MSSVDGHPYLSEGSGCYLLIGAPPALPTMLINAFVDNLEVITSGHCRFVRRKSTMVSIHYQVFFYVGISMFLVLSNKVLFVYVYLHFVRAIHKSSVSITICSISQLLPKKRAFLQREGNIVRHQCEGMPRLATANGVKDVRKGKRRQGPSGTACNRSPDELTFLGNENSSAVGWHLIGLASPG